jgi:hypothetical protein
MVGKVVREGADSLTELVGIADRNGALDAIGL